ncbi:MAG TPA: alpha/beta fold hydrolase [Dehalococcoidia bacterium]
MEPRIQYARTEDGVSIAYSTVGTGPPIVLTAIMWGDASQEGYSGLPSVSQITALTEAGLQVTSYDPRGTGGSDRTRVDFSPDGRLKDLEAVVDRLEFDRFDLVGRMHGTVTAASYAVKHPERVKHLVLYNSWVRGRDYYGATAFSRAIKSFAEVAGDDWDLFTMTMAHWVLGFDDPEAARRLGKFFSENMDKDAYLQGIAATEAIDTSDLLPRISVPTLVVRDRSQTFAAVPELTREVASSIPGAQAVNVDSRQDAARVIAEFTAAVTETPAGPEQDVRGGLATILFTDVKGSTALTDRLGDAKARELLREHERITRDALKAHGGSEVKTLGDGFMASFSSATKALECAIALQQAFAERNESAEEPILVRVGLNAGEPIAEDDPGGRSDLFGTAVNMAARIAAKAEGGEVLVADVVRQLVAGKEFLFADRGETELRGFEDPVRVFEVRWRD